MVNMIFNSFIYFTDPYYLERNGLYIGQGTAMLSRAGMFRVTQGLGVDMKDRVYELHSFHSRFTAFFLSSLYIFAIMFLC